MDNGNRSITLVEPDPATRGVLTRALGRGGFEVRPLEHGLGLEQAIRATPPDLLVLDLAPRLGPDGITLTRLARAMTDVPILVTARTGDVERRLAAFAAGADDVVDKPLVVPEVVARARALVRRHRGLQVDATTVGDITIDHATRTVRRAGAVLNLRPTEYRLLATLCRRQGDVLSKQALLDAVWGCSYSDVNLVEVHMSRLR